MKKVVMILVVSILSLGIFASPKKSLAASVTKPDHIVIVMEENKAYENILGNPNLPYLNSLMKQGANFTNFYGMTHPSQPNYYYLFSGSAEGVVGNKYPTSKFNRPNLGTSLMAKGYTFAGYSEDMPYVGFEGEYYHYYAHRHNAWVNFSNIPNTTNQPLTAFPTDFNKLPTVSFVVPNDVNNMHSGSLKQGDDWLKNKIGAYAEWAKTHNSLLVITYDEDDGAHGNRIPTLILGKNVKSGVYSTKYNLVDLLRTIEDMYGLPYAGQSNSAKPITDIWNNSTTIPAPPSVVDLQKQIDSLKVENAKLKVENASLSSKIIKIKEIFNDFVSKINNILK